MAFWILLTSAAVAALLVSEWLGFRAGIWIAKPLSSTGFLGAALAAGALDSPYGQLVLGALVFSWLGDVLLIPHDPKSFLAGLGAFLLGHVAFAVAFLSRGVAPLAVVLAGVALFLPMRHVLRWLGPHLPSTMVLPVRAYVTVISAMVMCAAGANAAGHPGTILAGAVAFAVSDVAVARQQFVEKTITNKLWGLPLYYGAQLVLASTVR